MNTCEGKGVCYLCVCACVRACVPFDCSHWSLFLLTFFSLMGMDGGDGAGDKGSIIPHCHISYHMLVGPSPGS